MHGGAYAIGDPLHSVGAAARLARRTQTEVVSIGLPSHPNAHTPLQSTT